MIFILGIERSATTWVSNLLEAHPQTRVFVEPLSVLTARFTDWPDRFEVIENRQAMADYFHREFQILKSHKTWLLTRWFSHRKAWQFDLWLSNLLVRKNLAGEAARDFSEINFHRKTQLQVQKDYPVKYEVTKELRLNFNGELISHIEPEAVVLVVVRDVFANIRSINQHLNKGHLGELRASLTKKYGQPNLRILYRYWRDSYNSLLEALDKTNTSYLVVDHTALVKDPDSWVQKIGTFTDLGETQTMLQYVKKSNRQGSGIHNTNRSHRILLKQNEEAKKEVFPRIKQIFDPNELHPALRTTLESSTYSEGEG